MEKRCTLDEEKRCDDCGDCLICDLEAEKLCDNCMRCVAKSDADYLAIEIDEVIGGSSDADQEPRAKAALGENLPPKATVRAIRKKRSRKSPDLGAGEHLKLFVKDSFNE